MMTGRMAGGTFLGPILAIVLVLGFAYIIWILSNKESGNVKLTGQIIAIVVAVLTLIMLLYGGVYQGIMGKGWCGKGYKMMSPKTMHYMRGMPDEKMHEYMEKMMEDPRMHEWMEEYFEKKR